MGLKGEHPVKVSTRTGIGTYIAKVLSIQKIMRRLSPVNEFLREKSSLFRAYKSGKTLLKTV